MGLLLVCLLIMYVFGFLIERDGYSVNSVDLFLGVGFLLQIVCCWFLSLLLFVAALFWFVVYCSGLFGLWVVGVFCWFGLLCLWLL